MRLEDEHEYHDNEREDIGQASPRGDHRVEVAGRQVLSYAEDHPGEYRAADRIEAAQDDDRQSLEPDIGQGG